MTTIIQKYQTPTLPQLDGGDPIFWRNELSKLSKSINQLVGTVNPGTKTFATLPNNPFVGQTCPISDSNTVVWGANVAGGGANKVLCHWNETHWTVAAI